ncbi:hypothetical protein [Streptosporangium sp. NBC_01469]|uniref:hypothetical protein n=1 Tax=Streptosporangium sp. NBC_01469 TaxID=2903898 RepID=UPI002E2AD655|nr:hypothetical protein [Streptosporangium sp. NBC_01469]
MTGPGAGDENENDTTYDENGAHSPTYHSPTYHSPTYHSPTYHSPTYHSPTYHENGTTHSRGRSMIGTHVRALAEEDA